LEVPRFTSFFVISEEKHAFRFASSQNTRRILFDILKLAKCALKVNKIAPNKSIRIKTNKPDITKLKSCLELAKTELKMLENLKINLLSNYCSWNAC